MIALHRRRSGESIVWMIGFGCLAGLSRGAQPESMPADASDNLEPTTSAPADQTAPEASPTGKDTLILSTTVFPAQITTEVQYAASVRRQIDVLLELAAAADAPVVRAEHLLGATNLILARGIEPPVTRLILGIDRPDDVGAVRAGLAEAQGHLVAAAELLAERAPADESEDAPDQADDSDDPDDAPRDEGGRNLNKVHRDLTAFANALGAAWAEASDQERVDRIRKAASSLAILLEDDRPAVAAAAVMYQAYLLGQLERYDRALSVLALALEPIDAEAPAFTFYARLLRCRYLARQGGFAVAWSLLLRLEERCHDWFESRESREEAIRTVALIRLQVNDRWQAALTTSDHSDRAEWCREAARRIGEGLYADGGPSAVSRLGDAVPLLVNLPPVADDS
ncbi:MAG: hypothetical protein IID40_12315, partial [Planctomycetes bacterium]|nr:hypothetical protein [Planctomycetota bacterium]